MSNALEDLTVKARQRYARAMSIVLVGFASTALGAQGTTQTLRAGQTPGPRFLVPMLRTSAGDKLLGVQAADAIRERMMGDFMANQLIIVPKTDFEGQLDASGYSKTEALSPNDLRQLAPIVHAEEYLEGAVTRDASGTLTANVFMILVRPAGMEQPLPTATGAKVGDLAKQISVEVDKARKQIGPTRQCLTFAQQGKYAEATAAAQKGILAYPKAVFARVCMLEVADRAKFGPDSIIKVAEDILSITPGNKRALQLVTDAYGEKKMEDKYIASMMKILAADPGNAGLQARVVEELVRTNKAEMARPIIDEAVKQNPGDPQLIRLQYNLYRLMKDWKGAAKVGEEMIQVDTAAADTTFFKQMIQLFVSDSLPQKAQETAARATAKFPKSTFFWLTLAQLAQQNGQLPQALEAVNKLLAIDPKAPGANIRKAVIFKEMNQPDSVLGAVRAAVAAGGEDKVAAGQMALQVANAAYGAFSKDTTASKTVEAGERVLSLLAFADSANTSELAGFLMGATKLNIALIHLQQASKTKNCDEAKKADELLVDAMSLIGKNGKAAGPNAGQAMNSAMTLQGNATAQVKAFCKK
jgi:tetratricopeptide (TPR) repeat protein